MARNLSDHDVAAFRTRLCAVAERLFAERGPHAVTMRELARELQVSAMTPYRYFDDKDEILALVRATAFDRFAAALEHAAASEDSATARAQAVGRAYVEFAFRQSDAYKLMFDLNQTSAERFPELMRAAGRARHTMSAYMKDLVAEGVVEGDPETLGKIFWAMVHGLVMLELSGRLAPKPDFASIHATAMQLLFRGAAAASQQSSRPNNKQATRQTNRRAS